MSRLRFTFSQPGCWLCFLLVLGCGCGAFQTFADDESQVRFQENVAPLLERHCLGCHSDNIRKGDFSLTSQKDLLESEYLIPGNPEDSYLIDLVTGPEPEMPKTGSPLTPDEVKILRQWIRAGARWDEGVQLREPSKADRSWWSLRPLQKNFNHDSIDGFIDEKLLELDIDRNPSANRRTLIRRATYDLTGLPPTPEQVETFVNDPVEDAYAQLIDRLLASPQYGERWGRHWLDVVRFGESNGFERNVLINDLWPFRDYVIESFNEDKPFDVMIREHLAGDVMSPGDPKVEVGSAFLVAGPYDNVGNQDAAQKAQIRANTIDEMIRATGEAFLGLTIGCARCHDHKFDPIRQTDYYQLYATFAGVTHGSRVIATPEEVTERRETLRPLEEKRDALTRRKDEVFEQVAARATQRRADLESAWTRPPVDRKKTEDTFAPVLAKKVRLVSEGTDTNPKNARGFRIDEFEVWSSGPGSKNVALAANGARASGPSRVIEDFPGAYGPQLAIDGKTGARFISTGNDLTIELAEPTQIDRVVFSSARGEQKSDQPKFVFVSDYRIEISNGEDPWVEVASGRDRKPVNDAHRDHRFYTQSINEEEIKSLAELQREIGKLNRSINAVPPLMNAWVGNRADAPGPFHVFIGGSPQRKGQEVIPASLSILSEVIQDYQLESDSKESQRRTDFADWVTHKDNPLTPRVLANRVWHYHFGTGIVATPSDFGFMGERPSHPELLDFLAAKLQQNGWHLKPLHKEIMMSKTYRQSSDFRQAAADVDGDARMLWRFPPRRLSAEEIRDTMLTVSGSLSLEMGGPGFRLYRYLQDNVATYVPKDTHGPETFRRAVYHQNARASRTDLMTDFDQPDCAFSTARRNETTTPLQALTTLNHDFTLVMADAMVKRLEVEIKADLAKQVARAFQICFGRNPTDDEQRACLYLAKQHGLASVCRALLNTSELIYVL